MYLPSLHLGKVHGHKPVGQSLLIQVSAVAPDKGGHVIAWESESVQEHETGKEG